MFFLTGLAAFLFAKLGNDSVKHLDVVVEYIIEVVIESDMRLPIFAERHQPCNNFADPHFFPPFLP